VILWDLAGGKKPQSFKGNRGHDLVALSRDGKVAVLGCKSYPDAKGGEVVDVLELPTGKSLSVFSYRGVSNDPLDNVALTSDGKYVVTGHPGFNTGIVWEAASGNKLKAYGVQLSSATSAALIGGKHLITGAANNMAILWEPATGKIFKTFEGHTHDRKRPLPSLCVAVSGNGKYVVSYSEEDRTAILWETATGKKLQTFKGHTRDPESPLSRMCVAVSGDAKHVVTAETGGMAYLWQTAGGKKLHTFKGHTSVALSDNGKWLCTVSGDGPTRLWDTTTGKERCGLYSFDAGKDWLVVTPEGLFDGSEGAWRFVAYREPGTSKLLDDDATRKRFHRPGLLADVWNGK
jgi:WD40 repeat protein